MEHERRRRIDRVTSPDYLDGIDAADIDALRVMRDDCREEETRLSFARRVLHGQLDIVRAEQRRRSGDGGEGLVATLTEILADQPAPGARDVGRTRTSPVYAPEEGGYGQRAHDTTLDDPELGRVPDLDDEQLAALQQRLEASEAHVSGLRRTVLGHLDRLQEELIARYRDGNVDVDEVVASAVSRTEDPHA